MDKLQDFVYEFNQFIGQYGGFSEEFRSRWCLVMESCNYTREGAWIEISLKFRNGAKVVRNYNLGTTWFFIQASLSKDLFDLIATRSRSFSEHWDTDLFDDEQDELFI